MLTAAFRKIRLVREIRLRTPPVHRSSLISLYITKKEEDLRIVEGSISPRYILRGSSAKDKSPRFIIYYVSLSA